MREKAYPQAESEHAIALAKRDELELALARIDNHFDEHGADLRASEAAHAIECELADVQAYLDNVS